MTTPTTLLPLDPAVSPQRATRILPIRANLLPDEITSGRSARRARLVLAAAFLLILVVMGAWYVIADLDRDRTADDLASVTGQVDDTRRDTKKAEYKTVTDVITESDTITRQLSAALADDLPWATLTTAIRDTGTAKNVAVLTITGSVGSDTPGGGQAAAGTGQAAATGPNDTIGTMTVSGSAPDKKTIAGYVDALGGVNGLTNVYLTSVNQDETGLTFTLTADITGKALCGRFTTGCKSGGK